jgi:hypothetical protein
MSKQVIECGLTTRDTLEHGIGSPLMRHRLQISTQSSGNARASLAK